MKEIVLKFDDRKVEIQELKEHLDYYLKRSNEGMDLFSQDRKKEAYEVLKELRKQLKEEYNFYNKKKVKEYIYNNDKYTNYYAAICDAFCNIQQPTAYETLYSNLYDINDYIMFYYNMI